MVEKTVMTRFRTISMKGSLRYVDKLDKGSSFFYACLSPTIAQVPPHCQTLLNPLPGLCLWISELDCASGSPFDEDPEATRSS